MIRDAILYVLNHLAPLERRQLEASIRSPWRPEDVADMLMHTGGRRWMVAHDGVPIAVGGVFPADGDTWETWALITRDARRRGNREKFAEACRRAIADAFERGAKRVYTYRLADQKPIHAWYERIGLKRAQEMPRFGVNGEDFIRFEATT